MYQFDPTRFPPVVASLLTGRLPELGPGTPHSAARSALQSLAVATLIPGANGTDIAAACLSGLWLLHDFLDESHQISQDLHTPAGSYWHALMHRREPDPANSKYWWRRVGTHPVFELLQSHSPEIGYSYRTPHEFVDFCESVRGTRSADEDLARQVQLLEWQLLFDWCWNNAR